jgi:hypothetical protein
MSQHQCDTKRRGRAVRVKLGFDHRLDQLFMSVFPINAEGVIQMDRALCSVFCESPEGSSGIDFFRDNLDALKITVPEAMIEEVLKDRRENVGNHVIYWKLDWVATVLVPKEGQAATGSELDSCRATFQEIMALSGGPTVSADDIAAIRRLAAEQLGISP